VEGAINRLVVNSLSGNIVIGVDIGCILAYLALTIASLNHHKGRAPSQLTCGLCIKPSFQYYVMQRDAMQHNVGHLYHTVMQCKHEQKKVCSILVLRNFLSVTLLLFVRRQAAKNIVRNAVIDYFHSRKMQIVWFCSSY